MNYLRPRGKWRFVWGLVMLGLLVWAIEAQSEKEIALVIGEPWEDMRQRSSASIGPAIAGSFWGRSPDSDARLRFTDPRYGFVTPVARYLAVTFTSAGSVGSVRMSPQIEPLLLDDILKVALDLQEQWRQGGWVPTLPNESPPIADTAQWRAKLRDVRRGGTTYWQAGDQYQIMMMVHRFKDDRHPTQERYLITLSIGEPWVKP
ncbi:MULTISPECIES: hypothetical protein [Pseudomonas]|uniref:hypothetical protein n=1 Tax=Pseudomonas TaxID=286 RepID=UPI000CFF8FF6|nr:MULTISPECIES: hypothetical protein [Pseudomonas]PRA49210.1 hypothetical protein CQZ98_20725 [Pseudomonas sp. MYb115]QXN52592.1 hypothetical protein KW062_13010 [Pseudomonas fluorescens]WSO26932.1 hypothetical protein VUJ50_13080 [Pseudomonas fluorescens]